MFKFNENYEDLEQVKTFFEDFKSEYNRLQEIKKYPYNDSFLGKIKGIEGEDEKTAIFLLQNLMRKEKEEEYEQKMFAEGWVKLTKEIVKKALEEKKKIKLSATATNDWATFQVEKVLKPKFFKDQYGLMELRAKTKGYALWQFDNAFCKLV